jgi:hypothetical protein
MCSLLALKVDQLVIEWYIALVTCMHAVHDILCSLYAVASCGTFSLMRFLIQSLRGLSDYQRTKSLNWPHPVFQV